MKTLQQVHDVLKQAEADYMALADLHGRSRGDLTGTAKDAAADYQIRASRAREAAALIEKATLT